MLIIETVRMIPISTLELPTEIYECLADDAPFSWGDNNRTLVFPYRIAEHLRRRSARPEFGEALWESEALEFDRLEKEYPGVLIDLEN